MGSLSLEAHVNPALEAIVEVSPSATAAKNLCLDHNVFHL